MHGKFRRGGDTAYLSIDATFLESGSGTAPGRAPAAALPGVAVTCTAE